MLRLRQAFGAFGLAFDRRHCHQSAEQEMRLVVCGSEADSPAARRSMTLIKDKAQARERPSAILAERRLGDLDDHLVEKPRLL
jgi:hypothetical protein